jgi:hypothetical protein
MKRITQMMMTLISLIVLTSCDKLETPLTNGYYSGSLSYQGQIYFDGILFDENTYKEVPSGGASNQKFPCLTEGTYKIKNGTITFIPNNSPNCSCSACLLTGDFDLIQEGNKIIFQKGSGQDLQIYSLTQIVD